MAGDRAVSDVVQDILDNVQKLLRAEVRLAKAEVRQDARQAAVSGVWLLAGVVVAASAWMLTLWSAVFALANAMPLWAATLVSRPGPRSGSWRPGHHRVAAGGAAAAAARAHRRVGEGEPGMAETVDQIEAEIDRARRRLGSNLKELERRVDEVTDWRARFRARPWSVLGVVCLGGVVLGAATVRPRAARGAGAISGIAAARSRSTRFQGRDQLLDWWDDVATALLSVAAGSVKDYIAAQVPGFGDEFERAARRPR